MPSCLICLAFLTFYILVPVVLAIRITLGILGVAVFFVGLLTFRGMVLLIEDGRFWLDGRWRSVDELSSVTVTWEPWPQARRRWRRSFITLVFADTSTFNPVIRITRAAAMRDGLQIARQLGVPFRA